MDHNKEIDISLEMCIEEERKKCLKNLQDYYKKYGCKQIETLKEYLQSLMLIENNEKDELKKQLELLELYS